tara:strand:+ start:3046 stop:3993 length:948 start_codon:yes stop_codon:yes gene_type:complete
MDKLNFDNIFKIDNTDEYLDNILKLNEICKSDNNNRFLVMTINENNEIDSDYYILTKDLYLKGKKYDNEIIKNKTKCEIKNKIFRFYGDLINWSLSEGNLIMNDFKYTGKFENNLPIDGKIIYTNGDIYEGGLENSKYNGNGTLKKKDLFYLGNFNNNLYHGHGCLTENKIIYEGKFLNGIKHGEGILTDEDNNEYSVIYDNGIIIEKKSLIEVKYEESKETIKNLEVENKHLEEQKTVLEDKIKILTEATNSLICKICFTNNVEVLFKPCGHLCACNDCTNKMFEISNHYHNSRTKNCPVCRKNVTSKIEVLIA